MTIEFNQLGLKPQLVQAVSDLGFQQPTPVQEQVIPLMLEGQDVIVQSQTGTGKTAAFMLPVLQNLEPAARRVQALVLSPTRELALQVAKAADEYGRGMAPRVLAVYGGQPYNRQIRSLRQGVDIVVGTPGRLLDLMEKGELDLGGLRTVILDEADEMLSMGFVEDIEAILKDVPAERQTALFSATLPPEIVNIAKKYLRSPRPVSLESRRLTVDGVQQRYCLVNQEDKIAALTRLFEGEDITSAIIFVRTRAGTSDLVHALMERGFSAEALNGDLEQATREQVLNRFRANQTTILVATDVAARGLDIDDISHVFNFDLPEDPELYVHRVGRTARAGKKGIAVSLVTPKELWRLRRIENFTRQTIVRSAIPSAGEIEQHRAARLLTRLEQSLTRGSYALEAQIVARLVEMGHDPRQVAAAALNLARGEESGRPIAPVTILPSAGAARIKRESEATKTSKARKKPGKTEPVESAPAGSARKNHRSAAAIPAAKGMVRLTLNAGKTSGVRPADVVGQIAFHSNIPGHVIGDIAILDRDTLVEVPQRFVAQVLAKNGKYRIRKTPVKLALA